MSSRFFLLCLEIETKKYNHLKKITRKQYKIFNHYYNTYICFQFQLNKHEFEGKICWTKNDFLENSIPSILIICSEENSMPQLVWKTRNSIFSSNTFQSYCFYDPKRQWQNWYMYNEEKPVIETLRKKLIKHIVLRNVYAVDWNHFHY